jgi:transposase InsO family protein
MREDSPVASKKPSRPHSLLPEEKDAIIKHALKTEHRHRKLAYELRRKNMVSVSPSSVYRVLKDANLIANYKLPKKPLKKNEIKADGPNQVWRTDITYVPLAIGHGYLISVMDSYSRYIVHSELLPTMTTRDIKKVIDMALAKSSLLNTKNKPVLISDNGTQLVSKSFKKFLKDLGVKHIRTAYRHPESNGRMEVFHKTLKYEHVYLREVYQNLLVARQDILSFIYKYNHERLHQGIGFVTPYECYTGQDEVIKKKYKQQLQNAISRRKELNTQRHLNNKSLSAA